MSQRGVSEETEVTDSIAEAPVDTQAAAPARRRKRPVWFALLAVLVLLAGGGWLIWSGLTPGEPESAPLPSPFVVSSTAAASSDETAVATTSLAANFLEIPSLGVKAPLVSGEVVSRDGARTLEIPSDPARLTLYNKGARACDAKGTVLLAGHVSSYGVHGALWPLSGVQPLAKAVITCADGTPTVWQVVSVNVNRKSELPQDIFTSKGALRAVIITCGGPVMPDGHYRDNVRVELRRTAVGTATSSK